MGRYLLPSRNVLGMVINKESNIQQKFKKPISRDMFHSQPRACSREVLMLIDLLAVHIYEEALWEELISCHHVLGPLDDILPQRLSSQQVLRKLSWAPGCVNWMPHWTFQSWNPSRSWRNPASTSVDSPSGGLKAQDGSRDSPQALHKPKSQQYKFNILIEYFYWTKHFVNSDIDNADMHL